MSVRRLRNAWWVDFRCEGIRYRKRSPENSQAGAKAYELVLHQRLARDEPIDGKAHRPRTPTFKEFAAQWFDTYVKTNNKPSEQRSKRFTLDALLLPAFGRLRVDQITSLHIEMFKAEKVSTGRAAKTINNYLSVLGKCLRTAQEWTIIESVPKISFLKVPPQRFDFLIPEESHRLVVAANDSKWKPMIVLALHTGMRLGELLGLEWPDIDLRTQLLTVRQSNVYGVIGTPKNNRIRYIPLTNTASELLVSLIRPCGFVFCKPGGQPMKSHYAPEHALHTLCRKAGLRNVGWHTLRHTFASQLVAAGVNIKAVQELLGHSDIRMTMRYSHLSPSTLRTAVGALEHPLVLGQQMGNGGLAGQVRLTEKPV